MIIRRATLDDREAITQLIAESARGLSRGQYSDPQIDAAIATVFGVDTNLIEDGTYFVADISGTLVGCGGWSRRKTLFGGDQYSARDAGYLDPECESAKIRAFFIHPDHARKGIARAILTRCEEEARAHGFHSLELMATLPGVEFYKSCGFSAQGNLDLDLTEGVKLELVPMRKAMTESANNKRQLLRHTVATLAYRGGKAVANAPDGFNSFRISDGSRTPEQILAHIGDLLDWAISIAKGKQTWHDSKPLPWNEEVARFFAALEAFDSYLASDNALNAPEEKLFQGPIADALTHVGQIAMLRRMAGTAIKGENYFKAEIEVGRIGPEQSTRRTEFD